MLGILRFQIRFLSPDDIGVVDMNDIAQDQAATKIVDRIPKPGMDSQLEAAIRKLTAAALQFPGHLGVNVIRPSLPQQPGFRLIYRFDTCEHLRAWEESDVQHALVDEANRYTQGAPRYERLTGLETWFTLPSQPGLHPPPRGKMTAVSWLGIFPLVYLYSELTQYALPHTTPFIVRIAVITALVVPTMSYLVAPRLTRLFKAWLYPHLK